MENPQRHISDGPRTASRVSPVSLVTGDPYGIHMEPWHFWKRQQRPRQRRDTQPRNSCRRLQKPLQAGTAHVHNHVGMVRRNDQEGRRGRAPSYLLLVDPGPDLVHAPFQRSQGCLATGSPSGCNGSRHNPEEVENDRKRQVHRIDHSSLMDRVSSKNATGW